MVPTEAYLDDLAKRLLDRLPFAHRGELLIAVNDSDPSAARIDWEEPGHSPIIKTHIDLVDLLTDQEFDALCAHEHRHLAGWWGWQEHFCLQNANRSRAGTSGRCGRS
jgi:hypothetical protein